ncbi:MAG: CoA transferase [Chloroflexota bacterium]
MSAVALATDLLRTAGLPGDGATSISVDGADPVLATPFPIGGATAASLAACGAAAADIWRLRTGHTQTVRTSARAAAASLLGSSFLRIAEKPEWQVPSRDNRPLVELYPCRDGRWIHIHGGLPHLAAGTARVLGIPVDSATHESVARAVAGRDSAELEDALAAARMCGAIVRSPEEWQHHVQGSLITQLPCVDIVKLASGPPVPFADGPRPLSTVRILDLTRILAGPACARTLAHFGADVLHITSPRLPFIEQFVMDTIHGKRSAHLDLDQPDHVERLRTLAGEADVFAQGYRTGGLARRGFGPTDLAAGHRGLIYVSINAYGPVGPWVDRPGWEQLGQTVTGLAHQQGEPDRPRRIPAAVCDYNTGYLAALGTMAALYRRATEGGSYHVRASLAQTGTWLQRMGPTEEPKAASGLGDTSDLLMTSSTPWGTLRHLAPAVQLSETPTRWRLPVVPLGTHPPRWD